MTNDLFSACAQIGSQPQSDCTQRLLYCYHYPLIVFCEQFAHRGQRVQYVTH